MTTLTNKPDPQWDIKIFFVLFLLAMIGLFYLSTKRDTVNNKSFDDCYTKYSQGDYIVYMQKCMK